MTEINLRKPMLKLIVATDIAGGIGKNNQIPWKCPIDMRHFKATTMGHIVIMGRKTYESMGRPLPGRTNIIITSNPRGYPNCVVVKSLEDALHKATVIVENESIHFNSDIFVIGGGQLYAKAVDLSEQVLRTVILGKYECDTFFNTKFYDPNQWSLQISLLDPTNEEILLYNYVRVKQ